MQYDSTLTLRDARALYFAANGLGDGGYDDRWVKFMVGPVPLYFPNTGQRVVAVRFHDLHHVLTGYETTWTGEAEIGAWEIASGCAHHLAAWILNLLALAIGLFIAPRDVFRAYVRGRRTRNLYRRDFDDPLLDSELGPMRQSLGLDGAPAPSTAVDVASFAAWSLAALFVFVAHLAIPLLLVLALFRLLIG
jgi:hypothetical protein